MTPRRLTEKERALWEAVARSAEQLHPAKAPARPKAAAAPPAPKPPATKQAIGSFRVGERAAPPAQKPPAAPSLRMDTATHGKMARGKLAPEAKIDLHGMTLAEAHSALIGFVHSSRLRGLRLILVITGKGKQREATGPMPENFEMLRYQVPRWLSIAPLSNAVLNTTPAARRHGGEGALYLYLKKR